MDALVLSQLSYPKMNGIVPGFSGKRTVGWKEIQDHPQYPEMFTDPMYGKMHRRIFELVAGSRRYACIRAGFYTEWSDEEQEAQFAAVTFWLGTTSIFVSFRGTDETLVGWKEDFNMGYMRAVPSQRRALAYLKGVGRYTEGRIILGGHSKGGNLAIYASANAPEALQRRIRRIYSFDGPGFRKGFYERRGFHRVEDRYCKIVPEQSLVGMLLVNYKRYRVVRSYRSGVIQHDLMQWKIHNGKFVYRKDVYRRSSRKTEILNAWVSSLSRAQITEFVGTLYELLRSTQIKTVYDLMKAPLRKLYTICRCFAGLDERRRKSFIQTVKKLFQVIVHI
ncbi:MAG: Mbeg1-like protein [Candidatus Choladocola sp.]|nr:Mbeg1-like protein [Candidatus Choladocola sp.]